MDAADVRDQEPTRAASKCRHGGTEVSCRGGPLHDDVMDTSCSDEQGDVCWVCLDGPSADKPLIRPCKCPRFCHSVCIARWQLQSAGSRKEMFCDFCSAKLPDWKHALTPPCGSQAPAVMNVNFGGRTYSFEVQPGPEGYRRFTSAIRAAFALPDDSELNITFTCDEPNTAEPVSSAAGSLLTLQGAGAYDAAVHCASVSAARRLSTGNPLTQAPIWGPSSSGGGASSSSAGGAGVRSRSASAGGAPRGGSEGGGAAGAGRAAAGGAAGGSSSSPSSPGKMRMLGGLGRRLRNAMAELFGTTGPTTGAGSPGMGHGAESVRV
ncbi:hypothetical protein CHLRE_03g206481v5 [Chlamydomonas reinhardtii]|uniref:RING-CH-type domain-containing protein n=1 Tax=Chlamydomonas reinhardtii TaxID=3055 RepID=A0A2K3DZQ8_CHLRE|nr:uncharacterized protein CHLRE_03g206481v5 [Chlamydomonas reinhardtii]PNW86026.1 hypothetical protein CHLRE_03g206481v5 [Chlamydomonas reinhardtii]